MPEVQQVGAADYSQYQPSQYEYADSYNTEPQVYNEQSADLKNAAKSRLGATLLTAVIIAGGALWGGYAWGKKAAKNDLSELQNAADKYKEFIDKNVKDLEKQADQVIDTKLGGYKFGKDFAKKVKEELGKLKEEFNKLKEALGGTKDEIKEGTEKAAEETKKAAEETKKAAEDAAK